MRKATATRFAYDNLATAVAEQDGRIVRLHPRFPGFAREYNFYPHACNPASGWEKGKVERAIAYLRRNFRPLREFTDRVLSAKLRNLSGEIISALCRPV
jgi:transposase